MGSAVDNFIQIADVTFVLDGRTENEIQ